MPHAAYRVDDLEAAIEDEEVIPGPFEPAAFIHKDGAVIEYMQYTNLDVWFGQATPWTAPARMPDLCRIRCAEALTPDRQYDHSRRITAAPAIVASRPATS